MKKSVLIKVSTIFKPIIGKNKYVSGIGRSTYQLLDAIGKKNDLPFDIKLYGAGLSCISWDARNLPFPYSSFPLPMKLGTKITKLEPFFLKNVYKHDLLHIPHNNDTALTEDMRFVLTMHDTCGYDIAVEQGNKERIQAWEFAAKYSQKIITCSLCTKNDILQRFRVPDDKIVVIPWGVSSEVFHIVSNNVVQLVLKKFGINTQYFLAVSCSNERKNIFNLLRAYRNFVNKDREITMILLWSNPPKSLIEENYKLIEQGSIKFLDYVTDDDLVALYNGALATMYPSRYEGFGFPILESFACGTPILTCRNSSLTEVGGDLAVYSGEDDICGMTQAMEMFYDGRYDIGLFQENVKSHIAKFSWDETASKYIDLYKNILEENEKC